MLVDADNRFLTQREAPRMALIAPHVAMLAETALAVSETLPLQADMSDYARVLEEEAR